MESFFSIRYSKNYLEHDDPAGESLLERTPVAPADSSVQHDDHDRFFHDLQVPSQNLIGAKEDLTTVLLSSLDYSRRHSRHPECEPAAESRPAARQVEIPQELDGEFYYHPTRLDGASSSYINDDTGSGGLSPARDMWPSSSNGYQAAKQAIERHELFPQLVTAHINCCKIGVELANLQNLDEEWRIHQHHQTRDLSRACLREPELDIVMEWYLSVLVKLTESLEGIHSTEIQWYSKVYAQLNHLGPSSTSTTRMQGEEFEEQNNIKDTQGFDYVIEKTMMDRSKLWFNPEEGIAMDLVNQDDIVKDWLRSRYDRFEICDLRGQVGKKRRQGKHPEDARELLLQWFLNHQEWPYPSEEEKQKLAEQTNLEARQISNWFINQRKRHWNHPDKDEEVQSSDRISSKFVRKS